MSSITCLTLGASQHDPDINNQNNINNQNDVDFNRILNKNIPLVFNRVIDFGNMS